MRFVHINIHFRKSVVQIYEAKKVSGSVQVFRLIFHLYLPPLQVDVFRDIRLLPDIY